LLTERDHAVLVVYGADGRLKPALLIHSFLHPSVDGSIVETVLDITAMYVWYQLRPLYEVFMAHWDLHAASKDTETIHSAVTRQRGRSLEMTVPSQLLLPTP
jgi:hypothetical protein